MSSLNDPPQQNPILSAYERFLESTPFVTRSILSIQVFSYLASWFVNPHYALAMIPQFVIYKYEIYRLVLSPLVNTSLFNLLFAFLAFIQIGKRLENSVGSTEFAWLCAIIGMLTNTLYFLLLVTLYMITQEADLLLRSAAGVWTILFGVIAIESVIAPRESRRRLFFFDVPVLYYPLALYALFAFLGGFGGFHLLISAGIGYAYGFGYLDVMKLSSSRARHWEESYCAVLTRRRGWVQGHAAIGGGAWSETETMGMLLPVFRSQTGVGSTADNAVVGVGSPGSAFRNPNESNVVGTSSADGAVEGSGRTLGGASRRGNLDPRAARLEALERRSQTNK